MQCHRFLKDGLSRVSRWRRSFVIVVGFSGPVLSSQADLAKAINQPGENRQTVAFDHGGFYGDDDVVSDGFDETVPYYNRPVFYHGSGDRVDPCV